MIRARTVPCSQCGAVLTLGGPDVTVLVCGYCGAEVLLERPAPPPAPEPPPEPSPPSQWPVVPPAAAPSRSPVGCLITSFVLVSAVAGLSTLVPSMMERHATSSTVITQDTVSTTSSSTITITTTPTIRPSRLRFWTSGGCFLDADGDAISDLMIVAVATDSLSRPTVLAGSDGHAIWEGAPMTTVMPAFCIPAVGPGRDLIGVQRPDFTLDIVDPQQPALPVTRALTDKLDRYAVGTACIEAHTIDGKSVGLSTVTGSDDDCQGATPAVFAPMATPSDWSATRIVPLEKRTITVSKRARGTPLVTVSAADKTGYSLYSNELSVTAMSFDFPVVRADENTVALVGNTHPEGRAVVVGVDATTGKVRYITPIPSRSGSVVIPLSGTNGFAENRGTLYLLASGDAFAFDSASGKLKWQMNATP